VLEAVFLATLSLAGPVATPHDSLRQVEREARGAAFRYERALLEAAPQRIGGGYGDRCDERIGRFCFWFSTPGAPRRPIEPDPPAVEAARDAAVYTFRRWFALAPGEERAVGPLLRYLIEADRPGEAAAAARTHVWAAENSPESLLFLGLALHYTRDFLGAEDAFDRARAALAPDERRRLDDLSLLLEDREHSRYRGLSGDARAEYEATFWALADPWLMDPGNERRSAHYARHAWARIHAMAPRVEGRMRWGRDHDEILLRYGLPTGRQRVFEPTTTAHRRVSLVEYFDPRRAALTHGDLMTAGIPFTPPPGARSMIERDTVRSHYAPLGIRRTQGLTVQASVFPGADNGVIRVDALLPPDTVDPKVPVQPRGLLVLLDTLGGEVARAVAAPQVRADSTTVLAVEQPVPPGAYVYRIEIRDDSTGLAGLAQYRIDVAAAEGLTISDLLVATAGDETPPESRNDPALDPSPRLVIPPGERVSVYAEVSGLGTDQAGANYTVQWWIERAEEPALLRRAARWLGQRIGLVEEEIPVRVGWEEAGPDGVSIVFVTLSLSDVDPGLHRLGLVVYDRVSGQEQTATRLIRVDPDAPPLPRRGRS
jgi:hypothetical protein